MDYFQPYIRKFMKTLEKKRMSDSTRTSYELGLQSFIEFMDNEFPDTKFDAILKIHLGSFFDYLREVKKNKGKTLRVKYFAMKNFLIWAFKEGLTDKKVDELLDMPEKGEDIPPVIMTEEEIEKIRQALKNGLLKSSYLVNLRRKVLFALMWHFGAEVSEIYKLKVSDINMDDESVTFRIRKKERTRSMSKDLVKLVKEYLEQIPDYKKSDPLFRATKGESFDLSRRMIQKDFETIVNSTDIEKQRKEKISCSSIRHTRIKKCIESGRDSLAVASFFGLDLSRIKQYLEDLKIDINSGFKSDKPFLGEL
jgi:site-specific recombinase XerD